ncbi:MAG: ABC transporter substrate-binding protein [Acidobacteriota bacterium]
MSGGLAAGLAAAVFALACSGPSPPTESDDPVTLTIGVPQSRQLNPTHSISTLVATLTDERLSAIDAIGRTQPRLVEHWTTSSDGLTWTLKLRQNLRFHDGSPLTSADVKRSLDAVMNDRTRAVASVCLADAESIAAPGPLEVAVRFSRRCSFFLDDLLITITRTLPDGTTAGTGPFVLVSQDETSCTLEANDRYHLGKPAIERVVFRSYSTLREAWAEMLRGSVDFLWEVGPDSAEFLRDQASVEVRSFTNYYAYTIVPNSAREPFSRPEVRRALSLAVDRAALLRHALRGQGVVATSPIWPHTWARKAETTPLPHAPDEAVALLRQALGRPEHVPRGSSPLFTFTCLVPQGFTVYERLALVVQQQLRAVDVDMRLESLPADVVNSRVMAEGDFDAVLLPILGGPSLSVLNRLWHSPSPSPLWNFWGYRNASVDAALDALREAPDEAHTRAAVAELEAALRADPPGIVLVWSDTLQAVSRRFIVPESGNGRDALHVLGAWRHHPEEARQP